MSPDRKPTLSVRQRQQIRFAAFLGGFLGVVLGATTGAFAGLTVYLVTAPDWGAAHFTGHPHLLIGALAGALAGGWGGARGTIAAARKRL
ncbi:MAG TPA: hypothetical protein VE975_08090 [Actinomycetota bacterium]|jgi:ABC-type antimicrobial peptide transport system permease subunit|nr:hypothetical protein [Actinomycetota bacterium]